MMNNRYLFFLVALFLAAAAALPVSMGDSVVMAISNSDGRPANFSEKGPMFEGMIDGSSVIQSMYEKADKIKDYSCNFEIDVFKKSTTVREKGKFYFKKPRMMRSEEHGEYHPGAVVVFRRDGTVRAHYGGWMKIFTATVDPNDSRLLASNGYPMKGTDFLSLAAFLKNWLAEGIKSRITPDPVAVEGISKKVLVLEMYRPSKPQFVLKKVYLDPATLLPMRWDDHDYANPSLSKWTDIKTNLGLSDDLFDL